MRAAVLAAAALFLAACVPAPAPPPPPEPQAAEPEPEPEPIVMSVPERPVSRESESAAIYYRRLEDDLVARGLMRTDGGGVDTAYGAPELARNFEKVALFSELTQMGGRFVADARPGRLNRWRGPVRIQMHFGPALSPEERRREETVVSAYAARLARVTGHPISVVEEGGNFHVFLVNLDEQRAIAPAIQQAAPGLGRSGAAGIASLGRSTYCTVFALASAADPNVLANAVALVRTEHPPLSRRACYHEEIAQGLGLTNDSDLARPSIFNDDDEFALLTRHDEQLLQILYDRRLRPGMTADEARPIVRSLAREIASTDPT
jgi:hypothetical protein